MHKNPFLEQQKKNIFEFSGVRPPDGVMASLLRPKISLNIFVVA